MQLLVKHRADVNAKTPDATTPLMLSVGSGNYEVSRVLVDQGAHVSVLLTFFFDILKNIPNLGQMCEYQWVNTTA